MAKARQGRLAADLRDVPCQRVRLEDVEVVAAAHAAEDDHVVANGRRRVPCARRGQRAVHTGLSQIIVPTCGVCTSLKETVSSPPPKMYRCMPMSTIVWPLRGDGAMPYRSRLRAGQRKSSGSSSYSPSRRRRRSRSSSSAL